MFVCFIVYKSSLLGFTPWSEKNGVGLFSMSVKSCRAFSVGLFCVHCENEYIYFRQGILYKHSKLICCNSQAKLFVFQARSRSRKSYTNMTVGYKFQGQLCIDGNNQREKVRALIMITPHIHWVYSKPEQAMAVLFHMKLNMNTWLMKLKVTEMLILVIRVTVVRLLIQTVQISIVILIVTLTNSHSVVTVALCPVQALPFLKIVQVYVIQMMKPMHQKKIGLVRKWKYRHVSIKHNLSVKACNDILKFMEGNLTHAKLLAECPQTSFTEFHYCKSCNKIFPHDNLEIFRCLQEGCNGLRYHGNIQQQKDNIRRPRKFFLITDIEDQIRQLLSCKGMYNPEVSIIFTRKPVADCKLVCVS